MKRRLLTFGTALGLALALSIPAGAVDLMENQAGNISCDGGFVTMHFVHNKIRGEYESGMIEIVFSNAAGTLTDTIMADSDDFNRGTVHYRVNVDNGNFPILVDASDSIPVGMLVLSDAKCKKGAPKGLD